GGAEVEGADAEAHGPPARLTRDVHDAGVRLQHRVVAGAVAHGANLSERRDRAVDETLVLLVKVLPPEAALVERAGLERLDEHVGVISQGADDLGALVAVEVDRDAALVAVRAQVARALVTPRRRDPTPAVVAATGLLHLDHVGAEVAERLGAE